MNDRSTVKRWADDLGAWASSLKVSGFAVLVVALVVGGGLIVSPSLSTFVQQQREIAELRASVAEHREAVEKIDSERERWKDPVYIRSQARDRLYYVLPGETQLNVIDDIVMPVESTEETNAKLTRAGSNWARTLAASTLVAGLSPTPEEIAAAEQAAAKSADKAAKPANPDSAEADPAE